MDAQEFRSLQEAYMEVVESQQQLDEAERPIYGRGGGLQRTQTALQVLGKHATARDKKKLHNIPKGGTTIGTGDSGKLMSGEYDRGKGSKAARRAAALKKPEPKKSFPNRLRRNDGQGIRDSYDYYEIILGYLLDEGYASSEQSADKIILNMSEAWFEDIIEARRSEKEGKGSPESPMSYPGRKIQKERGEKGGRHHYSGSVEYGGAAAERGRKKSDPHSQYRRLEKLKNYPEKSGKYSAMQSRKRGSEMGSRFD